MAPTIKELIDEPFGPYPDYVVLDPGYRPKGAKLPQLRRLRLSQDGQSIGLDTSERYLSSPKKASSPVLFFGVLVIEKLTWLSEAGKQFLTCDLNERDGNWTGQRSSQNSRKSTQFRNLTLPGLYGQKPSEGFKIKVWIRCGKEVPAMFMTDPTYSQSLLLGSVDQHRIYEILTIDRPVYDLCRNFLERYRLVALIKEIMGNKEYNLTANSMDVDVLVNAYLRKHKEESLSHTVIFSDREQAPSKPLLRHVSRAEVRGVIAAHSGWLLAFYLQPQKPCPLNVWAWCEFIRKVRVAQRVPSSQNWGRTYEDDEIWDSDTEGSTPAIAKTLAIFGETTAYWETKLNAAMTKRAPSPRRLFDASEDYFETVRNSFAYDSDFSEPSTPGCSDSESDSGAPSFPLPGVLVHMYKPPTLLPGRSIWDCPISNCSHSINLLKLRPQDTPAFGDVYVQKKQYGSLSDEQVQLVLCRMVSDHYCQHLGVNLTKQQTKKQFISELLKKWGRPEDRERRLM